MKLNPQLLVPVLLALLLLVAGALVYFFRVTVPLLPAEKTVDRWRFLDGGSGAEVERKNAMIAKIDKFWHDFKAEGPGSKSPGNLLKDATVPVWMHEHLAKIDPAFEWEMGRSPDGKAELAICAGEAVDSMPIVETMIERAGVLPNWTLTSYRLPMNAETVESAFESRTGKKLPPFRVELARTKTNGIDVTVLSPEFVGEDRRQDSETAFVLSDIVIGENNLNRWQNFIVTKHDDRPAPADYSSAKASAEFAKAFAAEQEKALADLPFEPRWSLPAVKKTSLIAYSKETSAELLKLDRCRLTFVTTWPELGEALSTQQKFFSERYSKNGEKFAYLHVIAGKEYSDDYRVKLEQALDNTLRAEKLGCVVGTGRGKPDSYYFDLCLTNPDKAIPLLRQFCLDEKLPKESWLRFYDLYWNREWVHMLPDTPDLKNPTMIW